MPREVSAHLHPISRPGKRTLYRAVIGEADTRGMKAGSYFRFRARTSSGALSNEFIPKLLARAGEKSIMITIPPSVVEEAGLSDTPEVTLQLLGPTTAREAAKAAGKEKEFAEALRSKRLKPPTEKTKTVASAKDGPPKRPAPEAPVKESAPIKPPQESKFFPAPETGMALPPPPSASLPSPASSSPVPPAQASPPPRENATESETTSPPSKPHALVAEKPLGQGGKKRKPIERHKVPDDTVKRVEGTILSMRRKIIYAHLVPQIILGRFKSKREVDEAIDVASL